MPWSAPAPRGRALDTVDSRFRHVAGRGKGSHGRIYFGDRLTTLQDPKQELPKGTLRGMLEDLGIDLKDLS